MSLQSSLQKWKELFYMAQCTSTGGMGDVPAFEQCGLGFLKGMNNCPMTARATRDDGVTHETGNLWTYCYDTMMGWITLQQNLFMDGWKNGASQDVFPSRCFFFPGRHLTLPEGRCRLLISSYFFCSPYVGAMVGWWWGRWFLILRIPNGHSMRVTITPETYIPRIANHQTTVFVQV